MQNSVTGSCFCKAIQFEITFPTVSCSHCHCESCRKSHGAGFVTWTTALRKQFKYLTGEEHIKRYQSSAKVNWLFCDTCGSSLLYEHADCPEEIDVVVASLNGPLDREPSKHVSYEEHVSWLKVIDDLPKFTAKSQDSYKY